VARPVSPRAALSAESKRLDNGVGATTIATWRFSMMMD
jgi:hypothetical protein